MKKGKKQPKKRPDAKKALDAGIKFENETKRGRRIPGNDPHRAD